MCQYCMKFIMKSFQELHDSLMDLNAQMQYTVVKQCIELNYVMHLWLGLHNALKSLQT